MRPSLSNVSRVFAGLLVLAATSSAAGCGQSGVMLFEPATRCPMYAACGDCLADTGCGWCASTVRCVAHDAACTSFGSSCGSPVPDAARTDAGSAAACADARACGSCTATAACGWCGSTSRCLEGDSIGPTSGSCSTGWAYFPSECTTTARDAGPPPPRDHDVYCGSAGGGTAASAFCRCDPLDANTGTVRYSGSDCAEHPSSPAFCCAGPGYPGSGTATCECHYSLQWICTASGTNICDCAYYVRDLPGHITTCDDAPGPDGYPWLCCRTTYGSCRCFNTSGGTAHCGSGDTVVHDCVTPAVIAPTSCPSGTTSTATCSRGL